MTPFIPWFGRYRIKGLPKPIVLKYSGNLSDPHCKTLIFISFTSTSLFWSQQQSQMGSLKLYGKHFCIFEFLQWPSVYSVTQWQLNFATYSDVRNPLMCGFNVKHSQHVIYNPNVYDLNHNVKDKIRQYSSCDGRRWYGKLRFCTRTFNSLLTYQQYVTNLIFCSFTYSPTSLKTNSTNRL